MAGEENHLASFQFTRHKHIGRIPKGGADSDFVRVGEAGHGIKPAPADDSDFRLLQTRLRTRPDRFAFVGMKCVAISVYRACAFPRRGSLAGW